MKRIIDITKGYTAVGTLGTLFLLEGTSNKPFDIDTGA